MNKFRVLFAIMMVMTLLFTMAAVPAFADEAVETSEPEVIEHDHDGDGVADHDASAHVDDPTLDAAEADDGWATLSTTDFIALVVAAVILVAFVVALILFVPKKTKQK